MQAITPFIWFNDQAEAAVNYYLSVFKNAKILQTVRYGEGGMGTPGTVMTIAFELNGQKFIALNGGPVFPLNPAISFVINCETQAEIDEYWDKLSAGGQVQQCGWLTDKFGVTWQVVPSILPHMLADEKSERTQRVTQALFKMVKLDIAKLKEAYDQA